MIITDYVKVKGYYTEKDDFNHYMDELSKVAHIGNYTLTPDYYGQRIYFEVDYCPRTKV